MARHNELFIGTSLIAGLLLLAGCGGSGNGNNNEPETGFGATFKAKSIGDQVEELFGGVIGIADEVGNGKIGDPLGEDIGSFDTTLVESQFSWNSTMDFYNNIISIQNVWNSGLRDIADASQPELAATVTAEISEALALLIDISDFNGNGNLETADLTANDGAMSFRQQIQNASGRAKIELAQAKLAALQNSLETLQGVVAPTDNELPLAAAVVDDVIVPGYNDLAAQSNALAEALESLTDDPSAATVTAARDQWRNTRAPWEAGEGHIFGPVHTLGIDPKVDSWPVDKNQLDGALGGYDPDLSDVDGFPVTMKGFHAIEYLLYGDGDTLENAATTASRLQTVVGDEAPEDKLRLSYLQALGESFNQDIQALAAAW